VPALLLLPAGKFANLRKPDGPSFSGTGYLLRLREQQSPITQEILLQETH
jgi:hypothetical protein